MIELTIYIHTLHAKYCKHFLLPLYFLLLFVTRDYTPIIILCSSFETLFSANMDDFKQQRERN